MDLNGVAVAENIAAFRWGRACAHDRAAVLAAAGLKRQELAETLEDIIARGEARIADWGDPAAARDYRAFIETLREHEKRTCASEALATTAARHLPRFIAIKDEYEVARLHSEGAFRRAVEETFEEGARIRLHLAPPLLGRRKRAFGSWMLRLMPHLARLRFLRGTMLDPFGHTAERREERRFAEEYRHLLERLVADLTPENHARAVELAEAAAKVRGFGPLRAEAMKAFRRRARAPFSEGA